MFGNRLEPSTREPGYISVWCAFALSNLYGSLGFIMGGNRFWHPTAQRTRWARETYLRVTIPRITRLCVQSFQALHKNSFSSPKNHPSGRVFFRFRVLIFLVPGAKKCGRFPASLSKNSLTKRGQKGAVFRPHFSGSRIRAFFVSGSRRGVRRRSFRTLPES